MTSAIETIAAWSHSANAFSCLARRRAIDAIADTWLCARAATFDMIRPATSTTPPRVRPEDRWAHYARNCDLMIESLTLAPGNSISARNTRAVFV
jgi:hypothetical protein